jgi:putative ABC transport system substrate-binding protein
MSQSFQLAFRNGMREQGYVEGTNIKILWRAADSDPKRAEKLAFELARMNVDVIVAVFTPAAAAAKRATSSIPIVMAGAGDPVGTRLVNSLARPGGNVTGLSANSSDISGKRLSLLRDMSPTLKRIGVLINSADPFSKPFVDELASSGQQLGLEAIVADVRQSGDIDAAFAELKKDHAGAVVIQALVLTDPKAVAAAALRHGLPALASVPDFPKAGGLISYGANTADLVRRAAVYVDKILKGAQPAELPIQEPTLFNLVVNKRTAESLGLVIPPALLIAADEIIE